MKAKLQVDIDAGLIGKVELHRKESGKPKSQIVADALRQYLEALPKTSEEEAEQAVRAAEKAAEPLTAESDPMTPAQSVLSFFGAETPAEGGLKNFAPPSTDTKVAELQQRLRESGGAGVDESYAEQVRRSAEQVARRQARQSEEGA